MFNTFVSLLSRHTSYIREKLGFLSLGKDRLTMFENGVLKRIWGCRVEEVTGGWAKLYVERLHDVDSSVYSLISEEV
jgi:hypothetical protein